LKAFAASPERDKYAREVREATGLSHERVNTYLRRLEKRQILVSEKRGKQIFFRINKASPVAVKCLGVLEFERALQTSGKKNALEQARKLVLQAGPHEFAFVRSEGDSELVFVVKDGVEAISVGNGKHAEKPEKQAGELKPVFVGEQDFRKQLALHRRKPVFGASKIVYSGEDAFWRTVLEEIDY